MAHIKDYKLENLSQKDLETVLEWRNAYHIRSFMTNDDIIQLEEHYKWYKSLKKDLSKLVKICFYNEKPIGLVNFSKIDSKNKTCEWGFYIGDRNCPRGSGTMMGILALDFIFNEGCIRKLCAQILDFNNKSVTYHKKLGFTEEGRLVKQILKNNQHVDVVLMGLFKERWEHKSKFLKEEVLKVNEGNNNR